MKIKIDKLALLAATASIIGGLATLLNNYVSEKKTEELVNQLVEEKVSKLLSGKGE